MHIQTRSGVHHFPESKVQIGSLSDVYFFKLSFAGRLHPFVLPGHADTIRISAATAGRLALGADGGIAPVVGAVAIALLCGQNLRKGRFSTIVMDD